MGSQIASETENVPGRLIRLLRPSIVVLCGPAACGKSTFARKHFRPTQVISSDWARACICDDDRDQRFSGQAFALVNFITEQRIMANRLCVIDSTALTVQARRELLDLARKYQVPTTLLLFNAPLEICVERDERRERSVGRAVIERHHRAFEQTRATVGQEGFSQVVEIPEGDQEKVQIEILFRPVMRPQRPEGDSNRRSERSGQNNRSREIRSGDNGHATTAPAASVVVRPAAPPSAPDNRGAIHSQKQPALPGAEAPALAVKPAPAPQSPPAPHSGANGDAVLPTAHMSTKSDIDKPQKLIV